MNKQTEEVSGWQQWKDVVVYMCFPVSILQMPVFWLALFLVPFNTTDAVVVFCTIYFFVYPAGCGYQNYFQPAGLNQRSAVASPGTLRKLWRCVLLFHLLALIAATSVNTAFALMIFIYLVIRNAACWPKTHLTGSPKLQLAIVSLTDGAWMFLSVESGAATTDFISSESILLALAATFLVLAFHHIPAWHTRAGHNQKQVHTPDGPGVKNLLIQSAGAWVLANALIVYVLISGSACLSLILFGGAALLTGFIYLKCIRCDHESVAVKEPWWPGWLSSLLLSAAFILMAWLK